MGPDWGTENKTISPDWGAESKSISLDSGAKNMLDIQILVITIWQFLLCQKKKNP